MAECVSIPTRNRSYVTHSTALGHWRMTCTCVSRGTNGACSLFTDRSGLVGLVGGWVASGTRRVATEVVGTHTSCGLICRKGAITSAADIFLPVVLPVCLPHFLPPLPPPLFFLSQIFPLLSVLSPD